MNSKVFTQFRDPVNSYPLGEMNLGVFRPGRYSGFDTMTGSSLSIKITHSGRIKKSSPTVGGVITETIFGTLIMPSGCTVQTEVTGPGDGHDFVIDSNTGNANPRYDLVVCEHEYFQIEGGSLPIFFIQKGANDGLVPALAQPKKQVIIGMIKSEPNGNSFGQLTYIKGEIPLVGDNTDEEFTDNTGIDDKIEEVGIADVINNNPFIIDEKNIQVNDGAGFQIIRNIISSVNSRFYGSFSFDHNVDQTAGRMKLQVGIVSVLGSWSFLRFCVGKTVFDDSANNKGIEYNANYSAAFEVNDRAIPDVGWVKSKIPSITGLVQVKYVELTSWTVDRQYTISSGLTASDTIHQVVPFFRCIVANNDLSPNDMITTPTPYPEDSGRTNSQGIGVQFKPAGNLPIHILVNDGVYAMKGWVADGNQADPFDIGAVASQWAIRLVIMYSS